MKPKIYSYLGHACQPIGIGSDDDGDPILFKGVTPRNDSDGQGRALDSDRPEGVLAGTKRLPHGTMMRRAFAKLKDAGIENVLAHTIPPHPDSELGQIMSKLCYSELPRAIEKFHAIWRDCGNSPLNSGEQQIFECDGSYEEAIQEVIHVDSGDCACNSMNFVTSAPVNAICLYMKQLHKNGSDICSSHPILKYVPELYIGETSGRSMDIWNPHIVDVLAWFYRQLFGTGRNLHGLWLTLGGPFLWGETCHMVRGSIYEIESVHAAKALRTEKDIDMNNDGRHYAPMITKRLGRIAYDLVNRLKDLTPNFYFHTYTIEPSSLKAGYQAAGMVGVCRELCERMDAIKEIKAHLICSHAHECSPICSAEAQNLIREYPNIEFIAGVGWGVKLHTSGLARLCEGWAAIEVGLQDKDQWDAMPGQVEYINRTIQDTL
jgi:hypothetical protein